MKQAQDVQIVQKAASSEADMQRESVGDETCDCLRKDTRYTQNKTSATILLYATPKIFVETSPLTANSKLSIVSSIYLSCLKSLCAGVSILGNGSGSLYSCFEKRDEMK